MKSRQSGDFPYQSLPQAQLQNNRLSLGFQIRPAE